LTDCSFLYKNFKKTKNYVFLKSRFSSLGFYRLLQWQSWDVGFHGPLASPPSVSVTAVHTGNKVDRIGNKVERIGNNVETS